jgi:hypothetical protein
LNIDHKQKLLVGDLNIDWLGDCNESKKFRDLLTCFGYETTNSIRTRPISDKIIDHVVSNFHEKIPISNFTIDQDKWFSDHSAILSVVHCSVGSKSLKGFVSINDVNFETLEENFCFIPPEKSNDANEIANALMDASKIAVGYSTHTHTFKVKNPDKISPHFNFELFTALKEKDHWKEKHDKNPRSIEAADKYKQACSKFKELDAKLYNQYLESKFNNVEPKSAWKNINELLGRRKNDDDEIKEIIIDHRSVTDPSEIANELNRCFTSDQFECAQSRLPNIEFHESSISNSIVLDATDESEIREIINDLKNDTAAGPDGISTRIIKRLSDLIIPILVILVNSIFATGKFPEKFKEAVVRPIFKCNSKSDPLNYRPISILNIFAKIVEKSLYNRIYKFLVKNSFFYRSQYGFRRKSSTENAAMEVVSFIQDGLNGGDKVSAVFIDLRKAFDLVDHQVLLSVCNLSGIRGTALELLKNYLTGRTQFVRVNGTASSKRKINKGVIQGGVLGSLLFLVAINAIGNLQLNGKIVLYADDAVLMHRHKNDDKIEELIRNDMEKILKFFEMRKFIINASKTVFMIFSTSHQNHHIDKIRLTEQCSIERVDSFKYLGLYLDSHLKFNVHLNVVENKIASAAGALWKLGSKVPFYCRKNIYFSLVHSHLEFMVAMWGSASNLVVEPVQVLQNRAVRSVYRLNHLHNRVLMYQNSKILHVRALCVMRIAKFMFLARKGDTLHNFKFNRLGGVTRGANNLRTTTAKTSHGKRNITFIGPHIYNALPIDITKAQTKYQFRHKMKQLLLETHMNDKLLNGNFLNEIITLKHSTA